ncbi:MAG TPA: metallophosphoesterase, partial [Clostridia bacterium]|nr:metallophosphoesterase [Clostridia bacterium]
ICGHTHGGQIVFFGRSLHSSSEYGDRYRSGWYREQGADILVSEGVGTSILPMRVGTRSQIHRLILRNKPQG